MSENKTTGFQADGFKPARKHVSSSWRTSILKHLQK